MAQVSILMVEQEILLAVAQYLQREYGVTVSTAGLHVSVKSKQNYKAEWEQAAIKIECSTSAQPQD